MKRPTFLREFKLETYSIPVKDEYFEQAFGTESFTILLDAVQETPDGNALVFRQRKGLNQWETKQMESARPDELSPNDLMVEISIRTKIEDSFVLQELLLKQQATIVNGKLKPDNFDSLSDEERIEQKFYPPNYTQLSDAEIAALQPRTIYLKDFFSSDELKEVRQVKKSLYSGDRLFPAVVLFLNNRIVDLESNQVIKFKFTDEQALNLPQELYLEIIKFVGFEMNGYPEDEQETEGEANEIKPEKKESSKK